jgi:hypothetical protein
LASVVDDVAGNIYQALPGVVAYGVLVDGVVLLGLANNFVAGT